MVAGRDRIEMLPLSALADNPFQIGYPPSEEEVARSAYLVRDHGLTFPLLVRPRGKAFQLATGRRWLAACRMLGAQRVPALVRDLDDRDMAALAFEEAGQAGTLTPGHAAVLQDAAADAWVRGIFERLRKGEADYRVEADPEAARNLPLPQRIVLQAPAPDAPAPAPAAAPAAKPAEKAPPAQPRGIHDTLLGLRCRVVPGMWFQTVSEAGKRWVLESMASAGQIEISSSGVQASTPEAAAEAFLAVLAVRHPGLKPVPGEASLKGGMHRMPFDVVDADEGVHHRYGLLWQGGRSALIHLSNTARFFLYDVKAYDDMVEAAELIG